MLYSLPYILLILVFGGLSVYSYNNRNDSAKKIMVCIWSALIFVFFFGFRGFICDDWISYYPAFEKCSYEYVNFNIFEFDINGV